MIKRYKFRDRDCKREINADMKFTANSRLPKSKSVAPGPPKAKKTFISALQVFYNKINISERQSAANCAHPNRKQQKTDLLKTSVKEIWDEDATLDPTRKKEEAMNFIGDVAKNVLAKYDFFPKTNQNYLREGEGRHCSNPHLRDKEVYVQLLHGRTGKMV